VTVRSRLRRLAPKVDYFYQPLLLCKCPSISNWLRLVLIVTGHIKEDKFIVRLSSFPNKCGALMNRSFINFEIGILVSASVFGFSFF